MAMTTYKNHLPHAVVVGYISPAPHKTGAGISPPPDTSARPRERFFYVQSIVTPFRFMVGRAGQPQGWPDSSVSGRTNPVRLTTPGLVPQVGELSKSSTLEASSWPIANNAALTRTVSTRKPKSIVVCSAQNNWRIACISSPSATTVSWCNCACRQCSVIWQTTCRNFKNWRERRENNPPENLTQKQHSACWWGVCLHDMQEALSP
ncbi:TPA: ash family protein [Salmonella enterica subsp. enterica serovar Kodjovi]|nr:ash family protein [Salmonella enterica subsp. enterica serovar Kodjovi]